MSPIRLIDHEGTMRGVVPTDQALTMSREVGLDLVEVSPNERPPVCKIMDYGKHKYLQSKKQKQKHHERRTKEVRLRPKTDPHDRQIKLSRARDFLEHGDRVQVTMMFRGRERFHAEAGYEAFNEISTTLAEVAKVEQPARLMGRRLTMVLVPSKPPRPSSKPSPPGKAKPKAAGEEAVPAQEAGPPASDPDSDSADIEPLEV